MGDGQTPFSLSLLHSSQNSLVLTFKFFFTLFYFWFPYFTLVLRHAPRLVISTDLNHMLNFSSKLSLVVFEVLLFWKLGQERNSFLFVFFYVLLKYRANPEEVTFF